MSANKLLVADEVSLGGKRGKFAAERRGVNYGVARRSADGSSASWRFLDELADEPSALLSIRFSAPALSDEEFHLLDEAPGGGGIFHTLKFFALVAEAVRDLRDPRHCVGNF